MPRRPNARPSADVSRRAGSVRAAALRPPARPLIGTTIALVDGTLARAGGMVVKNVAGYDMGKLYVGSLGTLGVLVRANFKTLPSPRRGGSSSLRSPNAPGCVRLQRLRRCRYRPPLPSGSRDFTTRSTAKTATKGASWCCSRAAMRYWSARRATCVRRSGAPACPTRVFDAGARESFQRIVDAYVANLGERSVTYRVASFAAESAARALQVHESLPVRPANRHDRRRAQR